MLRRIFRKLHSMNRRSFLYILAKLHAKIIKSKQDTAKSFAYYNAAGACRLHDVSANVQGRRNWGGQEGQLPPLPFAGRGKGGKSAP